jgi:hypothetical protein
MDLDIVGHPLVQNELVKFQSHGIHSIFENALHAMV